ncbi:MAG: UDP-N-acetylmuramoyl-L-alanyl-D-glutamate--2,6-diaminopimelate ligase [Ornithinibacter sp.]
MFAPRPTSVRGTALRDLARLLDLPAPASDVVVTGVTLDSRAVLPGDLYAALPGARAHGAQFAAGAAASGAVAVLTDGAGSDLLALEGVDLPVLVVASPRSVLGRVAARVLGTEQTPLRMVGITGTNGKTTTAHLLDSALRVLGRQPGLIGTVETRIGEERLDSVRTTPEAPELHAILAVMAERGLDTCVMEVSSHALAQHRVDGVVYDVALFTNLSQDHLDFHADMEDYFSAKADLFTPRRSRSALICTDDDWGRRLAVTAGVPVQTIGSQGEPDWRIVIDERDPADFHLRHQGLDLHLRSSLPGSFNVTNTAMAAAALVLLGEEPHLVEAAVRTDPRVPGRMERVTGGGAHEPLAVVDYAHTPDAIRAALTALRPTTEGLLVCVTGAGGDRDRDKRAAMGAAAAEVADLVVVTDDNPRSEDPARIRAAVLAGVESVRATGRGVDVLEVGDRRAAIRAAVAAVAGESTATIAIVGKGHESGQEIDGVVHPFDDRTELRDALRAAGGPSDAAR